MGTPLIRQLSLHVSRQARASVAEIGSTRLLGALNLTGSVTAATNLQSFE